MEPQTQSHSDKYPMNYLLCKEKMLILQIQQSNKTQSNFKNTQITALQVKGKYEHKCYSKAAFALNELTDIQTAKYQAFTGYQLISTCPYKMDALLHQDQIKQMLNCHQAVSVGHFLFSVYKYCCPYCWMGLPKPLLFLSAI